MQALFLMFEKISFCLMSFLFLYKKPHKQVKKSRTKASFLKEVHIKPEEGWKMCQPKYFVKNNNWEAKLYSIVPLFTVFIYYAYILIIIGNGIDDTSSNPGWKFVFH